MPNLGFDDDAIEGWQNQRLRRPDRTFVALALQLSFLLSSESMGNHDSDIVDADGVG
jgi:hypothetical protein